MTTHASGGPGRTACGLTGEAGVSKVGRRFLITARNHVLRLSLSPTCKSCLGTAKRSGNRRRNYNNPYGRKGKPK